ncbi:protein LNK3-like isoform X2 [Abrus precatorius]|uniref:Protein LNK3-like isoform X2 n=1 Tax=Abrus precatorius TaxID=3816 RepID=A0A8B8LD51_ABRPR|nr:protein LNK3-like isoform X2 [Abrus precatorius]
MDWYYGRGHNDFLVPKDQEELFERYPSPDNWSKWGISEPEGFNSPQKCLIMNTKATEVEFNFIDESFNNEIEFDPSPYDKDQSSSSSVCGELPEQSFQQTALSCDHQPKYQLQDLSSFENMDDIFLDSVLEDFPCVENLQKSFFYSKNQRSNISGGLQKDIAASGFVPCNLDYKDCPNIEAKAVEVLDPFELSNEDMTMHEQLSHEESTLQDLEMIIAQFTEKTRICFRDALYRLARDTKHEVEELDGSLNMHQAMPSAVYSETMRSENQKPIIESETNSLDRAVANLMFNKMEINILDLEAVGSKGLQGKSSKPLDVARNFHYSQPHEVPTDAEVPRFGLTDQEATESHCLSRSY